MIQQYQWFFQTAYLCIYFFLYHIFFYKKIQSLWNAVYFFSLLNEFFPLPKCICTVCFFFWLFVLVCGFLFFFFQSFPAKWTTGVWHYLQRTCCMLLPEACQISRSAVRRSTVTSHQAVQLAAGTPKLQRKFNAQNLWLTSWEDTEVNIFKSTGKYSSKVS